MVSKGVAAADRNVQIARSGVCPSKSRKGWEDNRKRIQFDLAPNSQNLNNNS